MSVSQTYSDILRWSSTYDMLRRLIYLWPAIQAAAVINKDLREHLPTKREMKLVMELVEVLKPFAKVQDKCHVVGWWQLSQHIDDHMGVCPEVCHCRGRSPRASEIVGPCGGRFDKHRQQC